VAQDARATRPSVWTWSTHHAPVASDCELLPVLGQVLAPLPAGRADVRRPSGRWPRRRRRATRRGATAALTTRYWRSPPNSLPTRRPRLGTTGLNVVMTGRDIVAALRTEAVSDLRRATHRTVRNQRRNVRSPQHQRNLAVTDTANDDRKTFTRQGCRFDPASPTSHRFRFRPPECTSVRQGPPESANQPLTERSALRWSGSGGAVFVDACGRGGGGRGGGI